MSINNLLIEKFYQDLSKRWSYKGLNALDASVWPVFNTLNLKHASLQKWLDAIESLPQVSERDANSSLIDDAVTLNSNSSMSLLDREKLKNAFEQLKPWRKGPFDICDLFIDTEWQSNIKWSRIAKAIADKKIHIENKNVLDVGSGNGYYSLRMLGEKANYVLGIDPSLHYVAQFYAINRYLKTDSVDILPMTLDVLFDENIGPNGRISKLAEFDTVFSMGVLYHRRSPLDHIWQLKQTLKKGGQLVLETLVIESDDENQVLVPEGRYAGMGNVWFLPSVPALMKWLTKMGFENVEMLDLSSTDINEQRKTEWIDSFSLEHFLNEDGSTIEGLPGPKRAIISAYKK